MSTIFTRIISGEIPGHIIYEDDHIAAFLTIAPIASGHMLVVPRTEIGDILDLPDELYTHLMLTAKNLLAPALQRATGCVRVGYMVEGFGVTDHAHLHLVPLSGPGDLDGSRAHSESPEIFESMCERICTELSQNAD